MAYCEPADIETLSPGLTTGIEEEHLTALCEQASTVVDYHTFVTNPDTQVLKEATVCQVAAFLQTGVLALYGLEPGTNLKIGAETLTVAKRLCSSALWVLQKNGYTTPQGE